MKVYAILVSLCCMVFLGACSVHPDVQNRAVDTVLISDTIQYHPVRINKADGSILPWYSADVGTSYDTVLLLVWNFWKNMETDSNGLKYYMNHQVWSPTHDMRGLGGDQINMALSSWNLLYDYTGDTAVLNNMKYLADTYLARSLSAPTDKWPNIPYPYNTDVHSGRYDGDMRNGKWITQPDKAGSFGHELVTLYKKTGQKKYLEAAEKIAKTLMEHLETGDSIRSPLPFRVNARTGETGLLFDNNGSGKKVERALYTSNWTGFMMLLEDLEPLDPANRDQYVQSFRTILEWMKTYPLRLNKWGPFFEDIPGWSNTQINATTFAWFILLHLDLFPDWQSEVKGIIEWTHRELGNHEYARYKVEVMNEQTVYRVPGESHSSRQASVELLYAALSGDTSFTTNAIRTLNWATYTVADDGRNRYIRDDIWLTDGYGDYVRHYIRAMAALPQLAPSGKNRFLNTSSVVTTIRYQNNRISYSTFGPATDEIRLTGKPRVILCDGKPLSEGGTNHGDSYLWKQLEQGGVLLVRHSGHAIQMDL